ncbi:hypothetical protein [Deinococcus pimensis]|uniref:hypothetical protein n=1 Tax=Deinococcus pimensis TaxID=309888 RepID=UPI0004B84DC6|nr:hypothetical protein [Deinococcus pimensis]
MRRAIEQLRVNVVELQMAPLRMEVQTQGGGFFAVTQGEQRLDDLTYLESAVTALFPKLSWWARALTTAREVKSPPHENQLSSSGV